MKLKGKICETIVRAATLHGAETWTATKGQEARMEMTMLTWMCVVGSGGRAVERRNVNRGDGGSMPPTAVSKLRQFRSPRLCLCLSEETLKAGGPFYLVAMPGEVKHPTEGVMYNL